MMTMTTLLRLFAISGLLLGAAVSGLNAQNMGEVRERMVQRLDTLDALKADGAIGENNQGYVEVRANDDDAQAIVTAENHDRRMVYEMIAKKTGSNAAQVGQARARQIAANSESGVWLQNASGTWYQK